MLNGQGQCLIFMVLFGLIHSDERKDAELNIYFATVTESLLPLQIYTVQLRKMRFYGVKPGKAT